MIPNKTEEQILLQNFKYHDLEGLGYCNLRTFIKTHERLGVVLSKIKDIEEIFNHYDHDGSGRINYKQFCSEIFNPPQQQQQPSSYNSKLYSSPQQQQHNLPQSFIDILNNHLLSKGGSISLMQLLKEIQIIDYNNSNKITIDDFVKILRECGITLHQNDYQLLFGNYELFANGILYYNELLRQLLLLYWSDARETYTNELYDKNKGQLDIKELKRLLPKYNRFIEYFKFVCKSYGEMSPLNPLEFKNFVKYFSYGIDNDDELYNELLPLNKTNIVSNKEETYNRNELKEAIMNNKLPLKQYNQYQQPQQQIPMKKYKKEENKEDMSIIEKFVYALGKVNRRTLFSFIKHFRYYEDDFQCVSKYDFLKIIKDYRIDLSLKDIEKLFYEKSQNIQKTTVHYEKLFKEMIAYTMTVDKIQAVKDIYNQITQMANDYNCDEVTIDFIKQAYKSKHNILNQDESNCKIEFDECIELFHFCYKGYKGYRFTKEEFVEFYSFISLLLKDDNDFISLIQTEFKPQYGLTNNNNNIKPSTPHEIINNQKQQQQLQLQQQLEQQQQQPQYTTREAKRNITNNGSNVQSSILSTLEQILIHRGVRGLIYLHRQFLNSCSDLNHITLDTFIKVLQLQHIFLPEEQYSLIYNNFLKQDQTFDFFKFIRTFKQELNEYKLQIVEDAFSVLDVNQNEQIDIDFIKMNYIGDKHPDVIEGKKHCEEVVLEFYDAFELNYTLLAKEQYVNFEIFANYYEYVAFVYKDDKLFERVVKGDWGL